MSLNKEWHLANVMPKNPTPEQRLAWHLGHAQACDCRPLTPEMRRKLEQAVEAKAARAARGAKA